MAVDWTDIIITNSQLRQRIGGASANPNSESYISDAQLTDLITLKQKIAEEIVERKMESLSDEQITAMDLKFDQVSISVTAGQIVATGSISDTYLPVAFKTFIGINGTHLEFDGDIHATGKIYNGVLTKNRYFISGSDLLVLPNTSGTITA